MLLLRAVSMRVYSVIDITSLPCIHFWILVNCHALWVPWNYVLMANTVYNQWEKTMGVYVSSLMFMLHCPSNFTYKTQIQKISRRLTMPEHSTSHGALLNKGFSETAEIAWPWGCSWPQPEIVELPRVVTESHLMTGHTKHTVRPNPVSLKTTMLLKNIFLQIRKFFNTLFAFLKVIILI